MKKLLVFLFLLLPTFAEAQIIPALPVTLTNGTLADANAVMSNFNTIVTGVNTNGAKNGANSDITSLSALSTPITPTQGGSSVYTGLGTGTANTQLVATPTPINYALVAGNTIIWIPSVSNTGPATLSVGGTTATNIRRQTSSGLQPLTGGEIVLNQQAMAVYDGTQYELLNSAITSNVPVGTIIDTAAVATPSGYLPTDGSAQIRANFSALFNVISVTGVTATTVATSTSIAVTNSALFQVGWSIGGSNVTCNSTISTIPDGTHIIINNAAGASGTTTLTIGPYPQGDCSTTFNLPDLRGRATVSADTSGSILTATTCTNPASIGTVCGTQTKTLVTANLPPYTPAGSVASALGNDSINGFLTGGTNVGVGGVATGGTSIALFANQPVTSAFAGSAQGGVSTPVSSIQPTALVTKAIKF